MGLESGSWISDLDAANPLGTDDRSTADDHLRLIKGILKTQFPALSAEVGASAAELNRMDGILASTAELNKLDGATMTTTELNFLVGVLGAIIDTQGGQTIAGLTLSAELILQAGLSENAVSLGLGGTLDCDFDVGTYFHTGTLTSIPTFTFSNPAASGRNTSFTLEMNNAGTYAPIWPAAVDWSEGFEPTWSSGRDIVAFTTRDAGATWNAFAAGIAMA